MVGKGHTRACWDRSMLASQCRILRPPWQFFVDVIGCELVFDGGASGRDPQFMETSLSVHPDSELKYCFLRCGNGANFEVFEYSSPDQNPNAPKEQ